MLSWNIVSNDNVVGIPTPAFDGELDTLPVEPQIQGRLFTAVVQSL
jgi:hypothetical protein